jgi:hypothetical protein
VVVSGSPVALKGLKDQLARQASNLSDDAGAGSARRFGLRETRIRR